MRAGWERMGRIMGGWSLGVTWELELALAGGWAAVGVGVGVGV